MYMQCHEAQNLLHRHTEHTWRSFPHSRLRCDYRPRSKQNRTGSLMGCVVTPVTWSLRNYTHTLILWHRNRHKQTKLMETRRLLFLRVRTGLQHDSSSRKTKQWGYPTASKTERVHTAGHKPGNLHLATCTTGVKAAACV